MQIFIFIIKEAFDVDYMDDMYKTQESVDDDGKNKSQEADDKLNELGLLLDKNYTGQYVVKDIKYVYNPFDNATPHSFHTELTLAKTEWRASPNLINIPTNAIDLEKINN